MTAVASGRTSYHVVTATTGNVVATSTTPSAILRSRYRNRRVAARQAKSHATFKFVSTSEQAGARSTASPKSPGWPPKWFASAEGDGSPIGAHAKESLGDDFGR